MITPLRLLAALLLCATSAGAASLRIVTINVWSGLDYRGTFRFGEYEDPARREQRYQVLLQQLRELSPDVILLQEANPVSTFSDRLADDLGHECVHQVCMGGIKFGPLGIPSNFKEGIAILARSDLGLRHVHTWKLSGGPGLYGDALTLQFSETSFALVASVVVDGTTVYLVNTHLHSVPQQDTTLSRRMEVDVQNGAITREQWADASRTWTEGLELQTEQLRVLGERLAELPPQIPVLLGGDFNMPPDQPSLAAFRQQQQYLDACASLTPGSPTWDPAGNENVRYSTQLTDASGAPRDAYGRLEAYANATPARIDHLLLSRHFASQDVRGVSVVLNAATAGMHASDHYGALAEVDLNGVAGGAAASTLTEKSSTELLPILAYGTDTGFGYGLKVFALNHFRGRESFDLLLFNSTRGERWYRFVVSVPDFELRQGTRYPLAVDLTVDYDKWISNSFFGIGNATRFEDREHYTREPLEISLVASRGVTPAVVVQAGAKVLTVRNSDYADTSALLALTQPISAGRATATSLTASVRYDTRNSFIAPTRGLVLQGEVEVAPKFGWTNVHSMRAGALIQYYAELFYPTTVLAARLWFQGLSGDNLPVQMLLPIGGNRTLRGYVQDRYLDMVSGVANVELRFPIFRRLGGIFGYDLGKVWHRPSDVSLARWAVNPVAGLRFSFETFVVRLDIGFGPETTGFYLNFGQLF